MQETPKWLKELIKWFPTGVGGVATGHFIINEDLEKAVISSMVTAGLSLWAKFSSGFMKKLEEGVNQRGEKSAEWLLKQTDTLPNKIQWKFSGFQDKYYRSLIDKCLKLKTEGFNIGLPLLKLEDVFVPLKVASSIPRNVSGGIPSEIKLPQITEPQIAAREKSEKEGEIWHFLAKNHRRIAILAPPGSGKTTLLQYITLTYAQKQHRKHKAPDLIPVLLRLRDVREQLLKKEPPSLSELIQEEIKGLPSTENLNPPPDWFEERFKNGKYLVMLDGLDEVAKKSDRCTVSRWVANQMKNHPKTAFILTSRPHGYENNIFGEQVDIVLEIQPFNLGQMKQFIQGWYLQTEIAQQGRNTAAVKQEAQNQADDLIEALLQNPAIRTMASNPLLVTMIATIHHLGNALPGKRVELYKEICDVLLGRRVYAKKINLPLTGEQNQSLLQLLALDLMKRGTQTFTLEESKSLIQERLQKVPSNKLTAGEWLETIKNNVGLIVEKETGIYEFAHLSFQEYLAAVQVKTSNQENILIDNFQNSEWSETIRLYAAQGDPTELIKVALQNLSVPSLCLAYDCWKEGKYIEAKTEKALEEILESGLDSSKPDIAKMAAQVKLSRRLNNLYNIDDTVAIDCTYITHAEYQLFVDEQLNSQKHFSSGSAKKPITGISYQNALKFCTWLNFNPISPAHNNENTQDIYYYRLPTVNETKNISAKEHKQLKCWTIGEVISQEKGIQDKGIRILKAKIPSKYEKLANYLAAEEWEKADHETAEIMLKIANRENQGDFDVNSINRFPKQELRTIDQLWLHYSYGHFGLGVQATIWEAIGGTPISGTYHPLKWCVDDSRNTREILSAFIQRFIDCKIERCPIEQVLQTLPKCEFEVIIVNSQGQEIQRKQEQATYFSENLGNGVALDLVAIPSGTFLMGTEDEEVERLVNKYDQEYFKSERPQHQVSVQSFFMGKYPITQAQWKAVAALPKVNRDLEAEASNFKGDNRPVEQVSWYDAVEFCDRLSQYTGREYRLPSEPEWEYACRAGTTTPFYFGETITDKLANYRASETFADEPEGEYREQTTPVGQFPPNPFGLYDMHGNVLEWCLDDWRSNYKNAPKDSSPWFNKNDNLSQKKGHAVLRGGSWGYGPGNCRSASRYDNNGAARVFNYNVVGFRVVCGVGRTLR